MAISIVGELLNNRGVRNLRDFQGTSVVITPLYPISIFSSILVRSALFKR